MAVLQPLSVPLVILKSLLENRTNVRPTPFSPILVSSFSLSVENGAKRIGNLSGAIPTPLS